MKMLVGILTIIAGIYTLVVLYVARLLMEQFVA